MAGYAQGKSREKSRHGEREASSAWLMIFTPLLAVTSDRQDVINYARTEQQQQRYDKQVPSEGKPRQGEACSRTDSVKKIVRTWVCCNFPPYQQLSVFIKLMTNAGGYFIDLLEGQITEIITLLWLLFLNLRLFCNPWNDCLLLDAAFGSTLILYWLQNDHNFLYV